MNNDIADVEKLIPFIREIIEALSLPSNIAFCINLAVEEAVSNVMMYAYDSPGNILTLSADSDGRNVTFTIKDTGKAFDPTSEIAEVDTTLPIEERPIGGLGMFLIKNVMDEIRYSRKGDTNILTIIKKIN